MGTLNHWKSRAKVLKRETYALYFACRDERVPWHTKLLAAVVVGYAFSPIDLIPDFIPVLGYLDDLVLVPMGVALVLRLIPAPVLADCRDKAQTLESKPVNWLAAAAIIALWVFAAAGFAFFLYRRIHSARAR